MLAVPAYSGCRAGGGKVIVGKSKPVWAWDSLPVRRATIPPGRSLALPG